MICSDDALRDQRNHLEQLIQLLGDERALLCAGRIDGDALARIAAEKQDALDALAEGARRSPAMRDAAMDATRDEAARHELRQRAREATRLNQFNGNLIAVRMHDNRRLLSDVGHLAGNNLYGPDGEATSGHSRVASQA